MIDLSIDIGVKKAIIKDKSNKNLFFNWYINCLESFPLEILLIAILFFSLTKA